jgi:hypothetical protein
MTGHTDLTSSLTSPGMGVIADFNPCYLHEGADCLNKQHHCCKVLVTFSSYRTKEEERGEITLCFINFRRANDMDKLYFNL